MGYDGPPYDCLPVEVLTTIFEYLSVSDRVAASQVCYQWYAASLDPRLQADVTVMLVDSASTGMEVLKATRRIIRHLVLKEVDLQYNCRAFWEAVGPGLEQLDFHGCDVTERGFVEILSLCRSLSSLTVNGCNGLFISGCLLEKPSDVSKVESTLHGIASLSLACNRYVSDALFSRVVYLMPNLMELCLTGCQISFHPGIYRRFYPQGEDTVPSTAVLTFRNIMKFIEGNHRKIKSLHFGRTLIDSNSLGILVHLNGLLLDKLYLTSCEQLTETGIRVLCECQPQLRVLDLSLCYQLRDSALLFICESLQELRELNLRRCHNLTDRGIAEIASLKHLEKIDLSSCEKVTSAAIAQALDVTEHHTRLRRLNLSYCTVMDAVICTSVCRLQQLTYLDLSSCLQLTDKSLHAITSSLFRLRCLKLAWCKEITDRGLTGGKACSFVPELSRTATNLKPSAIIGLNVSSNEVSVPGTFASPLSTITGLKELDLCGCIKVGDVGLKSGIWFRELLYLNLSLCQNITDDGLVAVGTHNPSLETLILSQCLQLTDRGLAKTVYCLPRLKHLDIQGCKLLTDVTLEAIERWCFNLQYLDVSLCKGMTLETIERLEQTMSRLHTVHRKHVPSCIDRQE